MSQEAQTVDFSSLFEHVEFEGKDQVFTEEILAKMDVLFEAKVKEESLKIVEAKSDDIEEQYSQQNEDEMTQFKEELVEQVDQYVNYFVQNFLKENVQTIEDGVKVRLAEKVLAKFNGLVEDFNIQLEDKNLDNEDLVEELKESKSELTNKLIEQEILIKKLSKKLLIEETATKFETETQRDRFIKLAETYDFDSKFEGKIKILSENFNFDEKSGKVFQLDESEESQSQKTPITTTQINASMKKYLEYLQG